MYPPIGCCILVHLVAGIVVGASRLPAAQYLGPVLSIRFLPFAPERFSRHKPFSCDIPV
jgi:hypothetical protein